MPSASPGRPRQPVRGFICSTASAGPHGSGSSQQFPPCNHLAIMQGGWDPNRRTQPGGVGARPPGLQGGRRAARQVGGGRLGCELESRLESNTRVMEAPGKAGGGEGTGRGYSRKGRLLPHERAAAISGGTWERGRPAGREAARAQRCTACASVCSPACPAYWRHHHVVAGWWCRLRQAAHAHSVMAA